MVAAERVAVWPFQDAQRAEIPRECCLRRGDILAGEQRQKFGLIVDLVLLQQFADDVEPSVLRVHE